MISMLFPVSVGNWRRPILRALKWLGIRSGRDWAGGAGQLELDGRQVTGSRRRGPENEKSERSAGPARFMVNNKPVGRGPDSFFFLALVFFLVLVLALAFAFAFGLADALAFFFFFFFGLSGIWVTAEAASDLISSGVRDFGARRPFDAILPTRFEVFSFFAMCSTLQKKPSSRGRQNLIRIRKRSKPNFTARR